jgi:hypothetical protein
MANPGTNTAIQVLAKSGVTAHHKIEALQKKNQELIDIVDKQTHAMHTMSALVGSMLRRIEALEGVQEEQGDGVSQFGVSEFVELLEEACQSVLDDRDGGEGAEIDPPSAPPAYTSRHPLADDGGSAEPTPSSPESH